MKKRFQHRVDGSVFKDLILGGQDGLVNVLGIVLGMAAALQDVRIVIIAGLAATCAESISMAAVAYTSTKAQDDFYVGEAKRERNRLRQEPQVERRIIQDIYYKKGFRGRLLQIIVTHITSNKQMWLDTLMKESNIQKTKHSALKSAFLVGVSSVLGSLIPVLPFFFVSIPKAAISAVLISALALFITGSVEGKMTLRSWFNEGFKMMVIGLIAAFAGFLIGGWLGVSV